MSRPVVLLAQWVPEGTPARLAAEFPGCDIVDARTPDSSARELPRADIVFGLPDHLRIEDAGNLKWLQLASAGVPGNLRIRLAGRDVAVTNLAGLYGPSIAQHAFALLLYLARNFHVAAANQRRKHWDRDIAAHSRDLHGRTLGIIGLGDIGRNVARLAQALGMRVVGTRRRPQPTPWVDQVFGPDELPAMLRESDHLVVAAPLIPSTDGILGKAEFAALKEGAIFINVSRGPIVREDALIESLTSGHLFAAGQDVYAVEPLPAESPLWSLPNVAVIPHIAGETINRSDQPARRFARNLHSWLAGKPQEGAVDLEQGY